MCWRRQTKWLTGALVASSHELRSYAERLLYEQRHVLNEQISALRRFVCFLVDLFIIGKMPPFVHTHTQLL